MGQLAKVQMLLQEYFEAVGVMVRDTPEQVRQQLNDPNYGMWIASAGGVPAGCVILRPLTLVSGVRTTGAAECKRLYVRPEFRGKGLADSLLDVMEEHARLAGVDWIYLDSKDDLHEALRIYKRRGYTECERYNDNPQATVFLRLRLRSVSGSAAGD